MDARGRILPRSDWPDDRHAPEPLEFVRRFCNTTNLESGADRLDDADDFDAWLRDQGHTAIGATSAERARLAQVRELLRDAAVAHRDGDAGDQAIGALARRCTPVAFSFDPRGDRVPMRAAAPPGTTEQLIGELLLGVADAITAGTWNRLKACSHCRWVVYDTSKNRSVRWCSMSACGGRAKVRRHRARHRPG